MNIRRAWQDTTRDAITPAILASVTLVFSFSIYWWFWGVARVMAELEPLLVGLVSALGSFVLFLVYNLVRSGPLTERDDVVGQLDVAKLGLHAAEAARDQAIAKHTALIPTVPTKRRLTDDAQGVLANALDDVASALTDINIIHAPASEEAIDLAADIGQAFSRAGVLSSVHHGPMMDHRAADRGIKILHSPEFSDIASQISAAFAAVGLSSERRLEPDLAPTVVIYVARRAEA